MNERVTARQFHDADGVGDWRVLEGGATTSFRTGSFAAGARLLQRIGELDGLGPRQPDADLRHDGVTVRLVTATDDAYGMSMRDLELARLISGVARDLGLAGDPSAVQSIGPLVIDALDIPAVLPFWRAIFGYVERADSPGEDLVDPRGLGPPIWFQQMDAPRPQRNRIHTAVWVPPELAEARVAAAIAAGGHLVSDHAPTWWVLADAEGNEADVATALGRE